MEETALAGLVWRILWPSGNEGRKKENQHTCSTSMALLLFSHSSFSISFPALFLFLSLVSLPIHDMHGTQGEEREEDCKHFFMESDLVDFTFTKEYKRGRERGESRWG